MGSTRVTGEKLDRALASVAPCTLPTPAWGRERIEWFEERRPVWVWVSWPDRPAERVPGWAVAANDRVVFVHVPCPGGHWEPVVWRNAVTVRTVGP